MITVTDPTTGRIIWETSDPREAVEMAITIGTVRELRALGAKGTATQLRRQYGPRRLVNWSMVAKSLN